MELTPLRSYFIMHSFEPQICGSKSCPYDNLCLSELAGYTSSQCQAAPPGCPAANEATCSGEPRNPIKCGPGMQCPYDNFCLAESAGYDTDIECCQDTRGNSVCNAIFEPVSCGAPGGKRCPYDNQCNAGKNKTSGFSKNKELHMTDRQCLFWHFNVLFGNSPHILDE